MSKDDELESVRRFSPRAGEYARHRPDYPRELFEDLERRGYLEIGTKVADVGSGTGIFTEQLIGKGCEVWAIEPNGAMRSIAETQLMTRNQFHSLTGDASNIPLGDDSVELVTAAQAFHWFDTAGARSEFERILRPPNRVALVWNIRDREASAFMESLEALLDEHGEDYEEVRDAYENQIGRLDSFFDGTRGDGAYELRTFSHRQSVGLHGLLGLVNSFSYMPSPGADEFNAAVEDLEDLFAAHADGGSVELVYETRLFFGTLDT